MDSLQKHGAWQMVYIEMEGPFAKTSCGNQYVVIITDVISKWIEAKAVFDKSASSVAVFVTTTFARMGFCDCYFINIDSDFEREIRMSIFNHGSLLVEKVEKYRVILERIRNGDIQNDEGLQNSSVTSGEIVCRGHHTEKLLDWISDNELTWDVNLERHVLQLCTQVLDDSEHSPFSIIHGGRLSTMNSGKIPTKTTLVGRPKVGRPRGRPGRRCSLQSKIYSSARHCHIVDASDDVSSKLGQVPELMDISNKDTESVSEMGREAMLLNDDKPSSKRCRGRPRKSHVAVRFVSDEIDSQEKVDSHEAVILPDGIGKRYGLRTTLKAKVKTHIIQRMLQMSKNQRITNENKHNSCPKKSLIHSKSDKDLKSRRKISKTVRSFGKLNSPFHTDDVRDLKTSEEDVNEKVNRAEGIALCRRRNPTRLARLKKRIQKNVRLKMKKRNKCENGEKNKIGRDANDDDDDTSNACEGGDDTDSCENDKREDDEVEEPSISCFNCPGSLFTEKELLLHETFHRNGSKLLHCLYCSYVTSTWEHVKNHLLVHKGIRSAAIELQKLSSAANASHKFIRKELAGVIPIHCSICDSHKMATDDELQFHLSCHKDGSKLLHCPSCNAFICGAWQQMTDHLDSHPEIPAEVYTFPIEDRTCPRCKKAFPRPEMVVQHQMKYHAKDQRYQCDMCGKTFKAKGSILRHQELHANIVYQCTECNYKTKVQKDFDDHQRIHQGTGYTCNVCGRVFPRQSQLTVHMEYHKSDRMVICDQCGHQANGMMALRQHLRNVHDEQQAWPCPLCPYVGSSKSYLQGHTYRIHKKKYKCSQCDFACMAQSTLDKHIDIFHNESERRFPCQHCAYRAREPKALSEHVRLFHNPNARKFPCEICGTEFKTKTMLRDHMPQHTGQRFVCQLCGFIAKYRNNIYRHAKKCHPKEKLSAIMKVMEPPVIETVDEAQAVPTESQMLNEQVVDEAIEHANCVVEDCPGGLLEYIETDITELDATCNVEDGLAITTTADVETVNLDQHSIVLDAALLAQAVEGRAIALPNNLFLKIVHKDQDGENITMQIIRSPADIEDDKAILHIPA